MTQSFVLTAVNLPLDIKNKIESSNLLFSKYYERDKSEELRELIVHVENAKASGVTILGCDEAIDKLGNLSTNTINIFAGKNKEYFFKIYIDKRKNDNVFFVLIKRKQLS
ncbi:hypothetical protein ACTWBQ_001988 [Citrobacter amalonaticus]